MVTLSFLYGNSIPPLSLLYPSSIPPLSFLKGCSNLSLTLPMIFD